MGTGVRVNENTHQKRIETVKEKVNLYTKKRGPLRLCRAGPNVRRALSIVSGYADAMPTIARGAQASRRREPTYAANLRTMIRDLVAQKLEEESEDERLRALLAGRVVGGADKFGCVKVRKGNGQRLAMAGTERA